MNRLYRFAWPLAVGFFVAACFWVQTWSSLPSSQIMLVLWCAAGVLALCAGGYFSSWQGGLRSHVYGFALSVLCLSMAGLGVGWSAWLGAQRVQDGWPLALEGKTLIATAMVNTMPNLASGVQSAQFELLAVDEAPELAGKTVLLSWYGQNELLIPAQAYRISFRAKQRHGSLNPHGFDYEFWLLQRSIAATGYLREAPQKVDVNSWRFLPWVERLRSAMRTRLFDIAPDVKGAQWAASLALGDQRSLSDADWQRYNGTGTGHLLAVSGSHIMMVGVLLSWVFGRMWAAKPQRLLRLPKQTVQSYTLVVSSLLYALISGWALPAQRTVLMLFVAWLAMRYSARVAMWHVLASAGFVALAFDPMAVVSPSFWLSYGAVALLLSLQDSSLQHASAEVSPQSQLQPPPTRWGRIKKDLGRATRSQLMLTVALLPIGALFFNQISLVSPIANALAIPVIGWVSTPLALIACGLGYLWGSMGGAVLMVLLAVQNAVDVLFDLLLVIPYAQLYIPSGQDLWTFTGLLAALACILLRGYWRIGAAVSVCASLAFAFTQQNTPQQGWRTVFLDVGQGMAVVVHSQGKTMLFDAGPRYNTQADGAARVIVPYLNAVGVRQLDHVVLSHADDDHTGGARSLQARMPVRQWWVSLAQTHPLRGVLPANTRACNAGHSELWAGLTLQWLHPAPGAQHEGVKPNAVSCVLKISDGRRSVLLTGDIEASQEASLVEQYGEKLRSTVLLAPHHGSKTSSTDVFLQAVSPQHVILQNGYRNRFGHPHPSVVARYTERGILQWRNDADGAVIADVTQDGLSLQAWRSQAKRYWHTPLPNIEVLRESVDGVAF